MSEPPYRVSRKNAIDYPIHLVQRIFKSEAFPKWTVSTESF